MEKNEKIFEIIEKFAKKHNLKITFDDLTVKILYSLIKSKHIVNAITTNKSIKRKTQSIILSSKNKRYNLNPKINLEKNKYIFIINSIIISLIYKKDNYAFNSKLFKSIFLFMLKLHKSNLVSFHYITLFYHLYLDLIDKNISNISEKIEKIMRILPFFKKLIKTVSEIQFLNLDKKLEKSINLDIYEILRKIFKINTSKNMGSFKYNIILSRQEKIFGLIKFVYDYYDCNIISEENKKIIKTNLINLYINNFNDEHFNYLYNIFKKILKNFNNKNSSKKSISNKISFINGISEFFLEIYKNENNISPKNEFYFDKYFIFDINEKYSGIKTTEIKFDQNNYDGITIIFSFYAMSYNYSYNSPQVLLSLRNKENEEHFLKIVLIGNKLYLINYKLHNETKLTLSENIIYFSYNICILHFDLKLIIVNFYLNKNSCVQSINLDIENNTQIFAEVGYTDMGDYNLNEIFNGMIGPVLIFNSKIDNQNQFELFTNIIQNFKGKYYLLGEYIYKLNLNNNIEKNYMLFNQEYYNSIDNEKLKQIYAIQNNLGKLLLYLNPDVIINTLGYEQKSKFFDYQNYFSYNNFTKSQQLKKFKIHYNFNSEGNISDFLKKENNIINSFMTNRGYDIIVFNVEFIYNYLLILDNNYETVNFVIM